jgi:hypothetical protein
MDRILKVQPAKELKLSSAVIPGLTRNPCRRSGLDPESRSSCKNSKNHIQFLSYAIKNGIISYLSPEQITPNITQPAS